MTYLCSGIAKVKTGDNICIPVKMAGTHTRKYNCFWYLPKPPNRVTMSSNFILDVVGLQVIPSFWENATYAPHTKHFFKSMWPCLNKPEKVIFRKTLMNNHE